MKFLTVFISMLCDIRYLTDFIRNLFSRYQTSQDKLNTPSYSTTRNKMKKVGIWLVLTIGVTLCACYNVGHAQELREEEPFSMEVVESSPESCKERDCKLERSRPLIFQSPEEVRKYVYSLNKMMGYSGRQRYILVCHAVQN